MNTVKDLVLFCSAQLDKQLRRLSVLQVAHICTYDSVLQPPISQKNKMKYFFGRYFSLFHPRQFAAPFFSMKIAELWKIVSGSWFIYFEELYTSQHLQSFDGLCHQNLVRILTVSISADVLTVSSLQSFSFKIWPEYLNYNCFGFMIISQNFSTLGDATLNYPGHALPPLVKYSLLSDAGKETVYLLATSFGPLESLFCCCSYPLLSIFIEYSPFFVEAPIPSASE